MRISMWPFMLALVGLCGFAPLPASAAYVISIGGGHCNQIGEWDAPSLTCTLTRDVEDGIVITNGAIVTLDGAGHVISASDFSGYGVHVHENSPHVTIRNVVIKDVSFGIYFERADSGRVENSTFRNTNVGIDFFDATSFVVEDSVFERSDDDFSTYAITSSFTEGTVIRDNHISSVSTAIKVDSDPATLIEGNTITNGGRGIHLYRLDNALVVKNVVSEMQLEGLYLEESFRNQIRENTF